MANSILACSACMRRLVLSSPFGSQALSRTGSIALTGALRSRRAFAVKAVQSDDFGALFNKEPLTQEEKEAREKESKEKLAEKYARHKLSKIDDPFHIAQAVNAALREGKFDNALLLTEKASRTMDVVVSWNALLGYQLEQGQLKAAFKLFNNVSKHLFQHSRICSRYYL